VDIVFPPLVEGVFVNRLNRFLAEVLVAGRRELAHVPNSGRMKELFLPGAQVWLSPAGAAGRKTAYTLKLVEKEGQLIAVDTVLANDLIEAGIKKGIIQALHDVTSWKREATLGQSRFDFCLQAPEAEIWLEVKSANLVVDKLALFPEAPTERGARHVRELLHLSGSGRRAMIIFVVMRADALRLKPHSEQDPAFAQALKLAAANGVEIYAFTSEVTLSGVRLGAAIPVEIK